MTTITTTSTMSEAADYVGALLDKLAPGWAEKYASLDDVQQSGASCVAQTALGNEGHRKVLDITEMASGINHEYAGRTGGATALYAFLYGISHDGVEANDEARRIVVERNPVLSPPCEGLFIERCDGGYSLDHGDTMTAKYEDGRLILFDRDGDTSYVITGTHLAAVAS